MNYQNYEKEIDLIDLCKCLLQKWKIILTVTLVGCLIGGIFSSLSNNDSIELAKKEELSKDDIVNMEIAYGYQKQYESLLDYNANSYIMNLNTANVAVSTFGFYVNNDFIQSKDMIEKIIYDENNNEEIAKVIGDYQYNLSDIISDDYFKNENDANCGSVSISVIGSDKESSRKIADIIIDKLLNNKIIHENPNVDTECINNSYLNNIQAKSYKDLNTAYTNAKTYEGKLSQGAKNYYLINYLNETVDSTKKSSIKYIAIGGILAAIVICGYYALIYIFSNTIKTRSELCIYGILEIATVSLKQHKDTTVASFEYLDSILNRLVSKKAILSYEKCSDEVIDILKNNKKLLLSKEIYLDSSSLNEKCEGLILLVEVKKTNSKFVVKTLETCKLLGIQIIGAIVVQ